MKKQFLTLFMLLLAMTIAAKAKPVDMRTVREVAAKFVNANANVQLRSADDLQLVTTYRTESNDAAFHIFNTSNGFVIVSADDCATPILGYSNEGQFDLENMPIQLQEYLQDFVEQIQYGIENRTGTDEKTVQQWELVRTSGRLTNDRSVQTVQPLVTSRWGQKCIYNAFCPEDVNGECGHVYAGCVATAMAQIMYYWSYPEHGTGTHSYTPSGYPTQSVDFGATTYDWDNMLDSYSGQNTQEQKDAVALLMWHCGVSVNMAYSTIASSATLYPSTLINYFNYSNEMTHEYRSNYSDASWKAKLKDCLNLSRPVYYEGHSATNGHAFVFDGYDNVDMFHINWGWTGSCNGYFAIGALNVNAGIMSYHEFNISNNAIFNIHPEGEVTTYVINISANSIEGGSVSGGGTFAFGENVALSAMPNDGYDFCYWEENGGIASTNPNYSFTANFNRDLVAVFAEPFSVTVSATEGGMVDGGGTFSYGESCTVSATPDEGYVFANWTKNGNVVSTNADYTFTVTCESDLVAHFVSFEGNIVFADANVKALCVANWDTNSDGELSYAEAAMVTNLGEVFRNNTAITSFDELQYFISLTIINENAFRSCNNLTSLTIPSSITSFGNNAFSECSGLSAVYYTGSLEQWCNIMFTNSYGNPLTFAHNLYINGELLTELVIPETVTAIKQNTFNGATCCTSLTLPNSVTSIAKGAFSGCRGLTSIMVLAEMPPITRSTAFDYVSTNTPVYVPCEFVEDYQASEGWSRFSNILGMCPGTIGVIADPIESGEISGGGTYEGGVTCTLTAIPNEGYLFVYWTEDGPKISYDADYSFIVTGDRSLTAHFVLEDNIDFADANVKSICVANWDTNGDGELSYIEAAMVTNLGEVFRGNTEIISFDELQYFISLASISNNAFNGCSSMVSLIIPNAVTSIGYSAFKNCSSWTSLLNIPNSVTSIGYSAFNNCRGLTGSLTIPDHVTFIGDFAFYNCRNLTGSLTLPSSVTSIQESTFSGCNGLNAVYYLGDIHQWCNIQFGESGANPLSRMHNLFIDNELVTDLVIPETVTVIKNYAFQGATCLTSLILSDSVTAIGNYAFSGCSGLTGPLTIPNLVTSIGDYAFSGCNGLTGSLTIPDSVTSIGSYAFKNCSGLTGSLTIPNSVTAIGSGTFYNCSSFTGNLTIPSILTAIEDHVFYGCSGITGNLILPNAVTTIGAEAFSQCSGLTGTLSIPNTVTSIGGCAFNGCSGFTGTLTIPNSVTSINYSAFQNCTGLTGDLVIPNSLTTISNFVFSGCSGITSLTLPDSVVTIGNSSFNNCSGLTGSLTIPNTVTSIGSCAFYNCSGLTGELNIPSSVTSIGGYAFYNCSGFTGSLVIPDVTSIGNYTFYNCYGLTGSLTIPNSVTSIGNYAFYGCTGFTGNLILSDSLTSIGEFAFKNCYGFTGPLTIGNSVTSIGEWAFHACIGFTGPLTIGNSVTSIGAYAFYSCQNLTSVIVFAETPPTLGTYAFDYVFGNIPVYVPCGCLAAYRSAPGWKLFTNIQEDCSQNQIVQLVAGINWFSSNVEITLDDLEAALVEALPETAIKIKGKDNNTAYNPNTHRWNGTLTWDLSQMYKIQTAADCEITLQGLPINPAELPITIVSGANWIAFPLNESMSLTTAFAGFAINNDVIKSKGGTSQYKNGRWMGTSLTELQPGQGYIYKTAATGTRTFTYPTNAK